MASHETPLHLVVRFSASNSDVTISIERPSTTTTLSLKQHIRSQLPSPANGSRLRLIHAGKVLLDTAALARSLNATAPPPANTTGSNAQSKSNGKQPVQPQAARVYIHCAIGDALTLSELRDEVSLAEEADAALQSKILPSLATGPGTDDGHDGATTTPAPRGFDRLLTTGFTAAEVATLRTQFLAIQSHTHTPDALAAGAQLLALEEQWLESGSAPGGAGGEGEGGFGSEDNGGLEDMLYGNLLGFFWPVGCLFWLIREEGVWTRRRKIAVLTGFLVNLTFGFLRLTN